MHIFNNAGGRGLGGLDMSQKLPYTGYAFDKYYYQ
jgi:hypothetical protein